MQITFLGATKTVTGSNFLVEGAGKKFLIDCGLYQGGSKEEEKNDEPFLYDPKEIDFMILTHAHIDHSGRIPLLYNDGFRGAIYTQKATMDLCSIMLPDSGHIQEQEAEWKNRKRVRQGKNIVIPLYTAEDAEKCMEIFKPVNYDEIIEITPEIHIRFNDAGHMLGSAIVEVWINEDGQDKKIVFSGDIGNNDIPLLSSPTMIETTDYLVMESTYGGRLHNRNDEKANLFLNIVSETLEKNGTVVIPSFAVGRTQEILYEINNLKNNDNSEEFKKEYDTLMKTPVYVDSPLAISATEIFRENMNLFDEETQQLIQSGDNPLEFPGLQFTKTADESKSLNEMDGAAIIISASGMCDVGRIKHHLKHNLWNPKSTILFVGYQAPGTLGYDIVNGAKKVKIFGEEIAVNARIEYIEGYSGHADQEGLMNFIYSFIKKPKHIFLVHGEPTSQDVFKDKIETETKIPVLIPEFGETYELDNINVEMTHKIERKIDKTVRVEILERLEKLRSEINDMDSYVRKDVDDKNLRDEDMFRINEKIKDLEQQILNVIEG